MNFRLIHLVLFSILFQLNSIAQDEISLDGKWEIIFDEENKGKRANWMNAKIFMQQSNRQTIEVPSAWETIKQDYEGVAFYKKSIDVPSDWNDKVIRIQFGAVNYKSEVWINDEVVGFHEGGFTPFEFRVDEMIIPGKSNIITLRVVGPITLTDKVIDGISKMETPQWRGGLTGGIWQEVQLVASGDVYVDDVFIQPNIENNTATIGVTLDQTAIKGSTVSIQINIYEKDDRLNKVAFSKEDWQLRPGKNKKDWKIEIPNAQYWSPDNPNLYVAEIIINNNGMQSDSWSDQFGMRQLTIKNNDFYLNGKRIYIKASFFEGLYPNGVAYPDSKEMARHEIQLAKDAGFNMIRPWRRPPVPMWLDLADEMGILVVGSPVLECMRLPLSTPYLPKRVEHEVRRSILRDRNRACIVQWELFNELHRPVLKQLMRPMAMLARELDPTRLILDESGGWAFGANMYLPGKFEPTQFNDIHNYPGSFINKQRYDGYLGIGLTNEEKKAKGIHKGSKVGRNVVPGLMSYVSELGYGSLPDLTINNELFEKEGNPLLPTTRYHKRLASEQRQMLDESGFGEMYPDMQKFYQDQQTIHGTANKRMLEAVRANPEVDGYCIHALAGGDWVLGAGLIDLWRQPKGYAYEATKAANQPRIVSIRMTPRNVYAERGGNLEILGINDIEAIGSNLTIEIINENGKSVFQKTLNTNWKQGVSSLFKSDLVTKKWKGTHSVNVKLTAANGSTISSNSYLFDVFKSKDIRYERKTVSVLEMDTPLTKFLIMNKMRVVQFDPSSSKDVPVLVGKIKQGSDSDNAVYADVISFVKDGGKAVYLEGYNKKGAIEHASYPYKALSHPGRGLWTCIPHLIHEHPIFDGLPDNTVMTDIYENVWATMTLRDFMIDGESNILPIVGTVAFDWFSDGHKMQYSGPGASWWGSDLIEAKSGKGTYLISQLNIVSNLGQDPVADKLLANMIKYIISKK